LSAFTHLCLVNAPQAFEVPYAHFITDLTEISYLAAAVEDIVETVTIPIDIYGRDPFDAFVSFLKSHPVDLVGISSMTGAFNNALRLARIAKQFDKYVVMGGYHPTALTEEVLQSPYVDMVVKGEGEITFRELVTHGPSETVAGLAYKDNGTIVHTADRPLIRDLDTVIPPLRRARPQRFGEPGSDYSIDTIFTSRGCPWSCAFCANHTIHKQWRPRSPENVFDEFSSLYNTHKKKLIKMWDANFLTDVKRVEKLCDLLIEHGLTNYKIWTESRVGDILRAEPIMDKLYRAGLRYVGLGIESPNPETLRLMKKKNIPDDCGKAIEILKRHRIKAQGYFIIGHYSETKEDTERYPEFAEAVGLRHAIFLIMTPYPGTVIFEEYKQENKIRSLDWDNYNNFGAVVETRGMDRRTLKRMYAYCYGRFYTVFSFFNQRKPLGMVIQLLQFTHMLFLILRNDKESGRSEIEDYLYNFVKAGNLTLSKPAPRKIPASLRWFKEVNIRFRNGQETAFDYDFALSENSITFRGAPANGAEPKPGFVFDLSRLMKLSERIQSKRTISLACVFEIFKNKSNKSLKDYTALLSNRDIVTSVYAIAAFFVPALIKGAFSLVLARLRGASNGSKR